MPENRFIFHRLAAREYRSARDRYWGISPVVGERFRLAVGGDAGGVGLDGSGNVYATVGDDLVKFGPSGEVGWSSAFGYGNFSSSLALDPAGFEYIPGRETILVRIDSEAHPASFQEGYRQAVLGMV